MVRRGRDSIGMVDDAWEPPDHIDNRVSLFLKDIFAYGVTKQVPETTIYIQTSWAMYDELLKPFQRLKDADELPYSLESVSCFIIETLHKVKIDDDITVLLKCYGFPLPKTTTFEVSFIVPVDAPLFSLNTLGVRSEHIGDGDGFTVLVQVKDYSQVPSDIILLMQQFKDHQEKNEHHLAAFAKTKLESGGYSCLVSQDRLWGWARKYKIRLRGIDAPEMNQDYGDNARVELANLIPSKCLTICVYSIDTSKRYVSDVYCDNNLVQKTLLEKGAARHNNRDNSREELVKCEVLAKENKAGLWEPPDHIDSRVTLFLKGVFAYGATKEVPTMTSHLKESRAM